MRNFRLVVQFLVLASIAVLALWTWGPVNGTRTIRVFGASMAPTLLGDHHAWMCEDCRFPFATGSDQPQADAYPAICPNCGWRQLSPAQLPPQPGDRLTIETVMAAAKTGMRSAGPRRWEAVVFRTPDAARHSGAQAHAIKRVVGLPGETVELREGDVWLDGQRLRKSLPEQKAVAILIHDNRYPPQRTAQAPSRWAPASVPSGWSPLGQGAFHFAPRGSAECDWLQYTHWIRQADDPSQFKRSEILDDYAYNRGESRRLHRVDDLLLTARIRATGSGALCFCGTIDGQKYIAQLTVPEGRVRLLHGDRPAGEPTLPSLAVPPEIFAQALLAEFSLVDHQVLLAINGRVVLRFSVSDRTSDQATGKVFPPQELAMGAAGLSLEVTALRVLRDIYYIPSRQRDAVTLGPAEFYVLGDNSPLSADSRTGWPGPGLNGECLIGVAREK